MSEIPPGWYKDPVDPTVQRYWDGEGWVGRSLPADATPGDGPPPPEPTVPEPTVPEPAVPSGPQPATGAPGPQRAGPGPGTPSPPGAPPPAGRPPLGPPGAPPPAGRPPLGPPDPAYPYLIPAHAPAPRPHGMRLAPLSARLLARLVDIAAVLGLNILVNWWLVYQYWLEMQPYLMEVVRRSAAGQSTLGTTASARAAWLQIAILVVAVALWFAYEVPTTANTGQTLGKRLLGIKTVRLESGEPLGFGRAWRRWNTLGLPTLLWPCCVGQILQFVDCLFVAIDRPLHQALHDRSAATVVVQVGDEPAAAANQQFPPDQGAR